MDMVIFEDAIAYDRGIKGLLAFPLFMLAFLGIVLFLDARYSDMFPKVPAAESMTGAIILFASAVFILAVYGAVLPRKIIITTNGIKIAFRALTWTIPYAKLEAVKPASGWLVCCGLSFITSSSRQIEIIRKNGAGIRICPVHRDEFILYAERALRDYQQRRPPSREA